MISEFHPEDGTWHPAVPLPFIGVFYCRCWRCGKRFFGKYTKTKPRYNQHYKKEHV